MTASEAPVGGVERARTTGSEAIGLAKLSQQKTLTDTPQSHLRNALAIIELARSTYAGVPTVDDVTVTGAQLEAIAERMRAALAQLEARHAIPADAAEIGANYSPARLIGYAQTGLFGLVDYLSPKFKHGGPTHSEICGQAAAINRLLTAAASRLDVDRQRHAPELEQSPKAAAQMLDAIGDKAGAAFAADLLDELSRRGHVVTWSVLPSRAAAAAGVHVVPQGMRDELARRRAGHASALAEMERTKAELALVLDQEG